MKPWLAHKQVLAEHRFKGSSNKPVDWQVEGRVNHLQKLHGGEDVEVPDLEVAPVCVMTFEHRVDGYCLIDAGHNSEMLSVQICEMENYTSYPFYDEQTKLERPNK